MDLQEIRAHIDGIDDELVRLFERRMALAGDVAAYKREQGLPVSDRTREREIVSRVTQGMDEQNAAYTKVLFSTLFDLSRSAQDRALQGPSALTDAIRAAAENTPREFPSGATVAVQGREGAYSSFACDRLFQRPSIMYFSTFESVFQAVEKGFCRYGILPIENSLYGSVTEVYDLMSKYNFHIARSVRIKIDHALLAKKGTALSDIREIVSHEQALGQCADFIKSLGDVRVTVRLERPERYRRPRLARLRVALRAERAENERAEQRQQPHPLHLHLQGHRGLSRRQPHQPDAHAAAPPRLAVPDDGALRCARAEPDQAREPSDRGAGL